MFIYNITTQVNWQVHDAWLQWMFNEHMQAMINTKCFTRYQLLKLHEVDETDGPTYAAQYFAESQDLYNRYMETYALKFIDEINNKWKNSCIAFETLMEVIDKGE